MGSGCHQTLLPHEDGSCVQPPYAENRTYGGVGGCRGAIPGTRPDLAWATLPYVGSYSDLRRLCLWRWRPPPAHSSVAPQDRLVQGWRDIALARLSLWPACGRGRLAGRCGREFWRSATPGLCFPVERMLLFLPVLRDLAVPASPV